MRTLLPPRTRLAVHNARVELALLERLSARELAAGTEIQDRACQVARLLVRLRRAELALRDALDRAGWLDHEATSSGKSS